MAFGDSISWDKHVDEVMESKDVVYYTASAKDTFENAFDFISTSTPINMRKALDCGCHVGRWCDSVSQCGINYTGVDQSLKAIEVAKHNKPQYTWINSFLWDMPFKEEFDFAFTNAVLQHNLLEEQERIIPQIYKSLKPGGVFLMTESTGPKETNTQRTHEGWIQLVEKYGFKLKRSFHKNPLGFNDRYVFVKEKNKTIITYCMMTLNRLSETIQCIKRVKPYVDRVVVIDGGSSDDTILTLRNWEGVELYLHPWKDNFSEQRNNYLKHAEENGGTDWILVSDPDELFSEDTLKGMRNTINTWGTRYNMIAFESHSVTMAGDKIIHKSEDKYWKPLLFKWNKGIRYFGNPHETLDINKGPIIHNSNGFYYHIKQAKMCWSRGARNAFIGGGGPNLGEKHPLWKTFRALVKSVTGIDDWNSFNQYMVNGNIDERIKSELIKFRLETGYDGASEWREMYKNYFMILHPEEMPLELRGESIE